VYCMNHPTKTGYHGTGRCGKKPTLSKGAELSRQGEACTIETYLPSVASRTTRRAAWLASSLGEGMVSPMASSPKCWNLQWVRKLASTLWSSEIEGLSVIRVTAKISLHVEQYQPKVVFVLSMDHKGTSFAMQTVSHSREQNARPVEIKRHHYRIIVVLDFDPK
jgi:hypothetical protein